jgi:hypothetical protein
LRKAIIETRDEIRESREQREREEQRKQNEPVPAAPNPGAQNAAPNVLGVN